MWKCPKCIGKGYILSLNNVDGGICYKCNGKGHLFHDPAKEVKKSTYTITEESKQKGYAVMNKHQEDKNEVVGIIADVLNVKKSYAREVLEYMDSDIQKIALSLKNEKINFTQFIENFYKENKESIEEGM